MSTSFNFPANPTLNQIVVLPDGNSAQWNGYAWVSVTDNPTYPLEIPKGGTGATNPATARVNLGINLATGELAITKDGTVAAPGLAFLSEPGLGWYRQAPSVAIMAAQGKNIFAVNANTLAATNVALFPGAAGSTAMYFKDAPLEAANVHTLQIYCSPTSYAIAEILTGAATAQPLNMIFPAGVQFPNGTIANPGIAFASEPGLGWYRHSASLIATAAQGVLTSYLDAQAAGTFYGLHPRAVGRAQFALSNAPSGAANYNVLWVTQETDGTASIGAGLVGTATAKPLNLNFTAGVNVQGKLQSIAADVYAVSTPNGGIGANSGSGFSIMGYNTSNPSFFWARGLTANPNWQLEYWQPVLDSAGAWAGWQMSAYDGCVINFAVSAGAGQWGAIKAAAFQIASDERGKERVAPLAAQHDAFMGIKPIKWHWPVAAPKEGDPITFPDLREKWGFSAQNLNAAVPLAVVGDVNATRENGEPITAGFDPVPILALTVLEVQDLINRVRQLESQA